MLKLVKWFKIFVIGAMFMATIVIPQNRIRQGTLSGNLVNNNRIDNVTISNDDISQIQQSAFFDLFTTGTFSGANPTGSALANRNIYTIDTHNIKLEEYAYEGAEQYVYYQLGTIIGTLSEMLAFISNVEPAFRINAVENGSSISLTGEFDMYDSLDDIKTLIDAQSLPAGAKGAKYFGGKVGGGISSDGYDFDTQFEFYIAMPVYYWFLGEGAAEHTEFRITSWYGNIVSKGDSFINNNSSTVSYGTGTKPHTYTSNELIQADTTIPVASIDTPIGEYIANTILAKYLKGQQTLSFTAIYGTYYDTTGNLVYSGTNGRTLKLGDIIEIRGIDNVSIAVNQYGVAKTFRITSVEYVWTGNNDLYIECVQIV